MLRNLQALVVLFLLISFPSYGQNWGIGFRLGDPSGLTVKKYSGNHAFELNIGRSHMFAGNDYYYRSYGRWYDGKHFGYKDHEFLDYHGTIPLGLQFHYLVQKNVKSATGLDWYYGIGAQLRWQTYRFDYRYKWDNGNGNGDDWIYVHDERVSETDIGVDGVIGLEYKFKDAPVSLFVDGTLFMEVADDPFVFWPQFGLGARFRF